MIQNRNIVSPIRSGFHFQDLLAIKICGDWFLSPDKYKWIQVEANPDDSKEFYLDDVVLLDKNGRYHFYQAKFKDDKEYEWKWNDLLIPQKKGGESLLKKWGKSFKNKSIEKAVFITNGAVSNEISIFLKNNRINILKLKNKDFDLFKRILAEFDNGLSVSIESFFKKFEFIFEKKDINEIQEEIFEKLFIDQLKATRNGLINLIFKIKEEARRKHTIKLNLGQLKKWCEFDDPRPLDEKIDIPSDFQFFNVATHKKILKNLKRPNGGIKIMTGKPGVGKSVYLSQLSEELIQNGMIVIKHHYYIKSSDNSSFDRIDSRRVIEALKAQFKSHGHKKYLGDLANKNSRDISLKHFISIVAQNTFEEKKSCVLIIDGLDYVVKEKNVQVLKDFLDEIFYPQKGLWIVFGTQPQIHNETTLQSIFEKCQRKNFIEIKGLNQEAVYKLLEMNILSLKFPLENITLYKELFNHLYEISQGNPLHLRYILAQLKNTFDNNTITKYQCKYLIPYGESIEKYYSSLWNTLDDNNKSFLLILISVEFEFTRIQFIECITSFIKSPADISQNLKKIEHLLNYDFRGRINIYHNSFRIFLFGQKEWEQQKLAIMKKVKRWLEKSSHENLRWAELIKLEYYLGRKEPILNIDREWLLESIIFPRNSKQINSQLEVSSKASFEKGDFFKAFKLLNLQRYYENGQRISEELASAIWIESIQGNPTFIYELDFKKLSSEILVVIANIANQLGEFSLIMGIIEVLKERLSYQDYGTGKIPLTTSAILSVIPYDRTHDLRSVYGYIIEHRDLEIASDLLEIYCSKLLNLDQTTRIRGLLDLNFDENEKRIIFKYCMNYDLRTSKSEFFGVINTENNKSLMEQIYLWIQGEKKFSLPKLPSYENFPDVILEFGSQRKYWEMNFFNIFCIGIIYSFYAKFDEVTNWIDSAPSIWSCEAACSIFKSAHRIAKSISEEKKIHYFDLFIEISNISDIKWPEERRRIEFKFAFKGAIKKILGYIILLKYFLSDFGKIDIEIYNNIVSNPFFNRDDLLDFALIQEASILDKEVYKVILSEKIALLNTSVKSFPEKSQEYVNLARLSRICQDYETTKELLYKAAENFLGYGYHKDVYLFDVLESVELCSKIGIALETIQNWIDRIIPLITNVGEYTDGDETHHLPTYLADFLSTFNKKLLYKFYFEEADKEELYSAQNLFKFVVSSLEFDDEVDIALASTSLDKESFIELKKRAEISENAKKSIQIIHEYFGEIHYEVEEQHIPDFSNKKIIDYSKVRPEKLNKYLNKIKNKWEYEDYLFNWIKYWVSHEKKEKIYTLIKKIFLNNKNLKYVSWEFLDFLYPLAFEFDNEEAFNIVCNAQINSHGWASYWTDKKRAEKRWDFIKEKYPNRYLEFFTFTADTYLSTPRCVEFFSRFNDLENAKLITEASIDFAEELMANSYLKSPVWINDEFKEVDEFDILLQRLLWPSSLVRERTASSIGNLIAKASNNEYLYKRLLNWISSHEIETIIAIGLLPIIKAFQICRKNCSLSFIKVKDIKDSIKSNSIVIEKILEEVSYRTNEKIEVFPNYILPKKVPNSFQSEISSDILFRNYLAEIYYARARRIEKITGKSIVDPIIYNAEEIAKEQKIELKSNHDFNNRYNYEKALSGFSTKSSEVFRSSFLRLLYGFFLENLISYDICLVYSCSTLPVDLSFWKIEPNRSPEWWPQIISSIPDESEKIISSWQFNQPIENILKYKNNGKIILAAEGAIKPSPGWGYNPLHTFSYIGFGYKLLGPNIPEAEEVSKILLLSPMMTIDAENVDLPLNFLENSNYLYSNSEKVQINDMIIYPLIIRNISVPIQLWQYFRFKNTSFNINKDLVERLECEIKKNDWAYLNEDKNEIVVFKDFLEGLHERNDKELPEPHGHFILIDEKYLTDKLSDFGLKLAYVIKKTYRDQQYSYSEVKKIDEYELSNISKLLSL